MPEEAHLEPVIKGGNPLRALQIPGGRVRDPQKSVPVIRLSVQKMLLLSTSIAEVFLFPPPGIVSPRQNRCKGKI